MIEISSLFVSHLVRAACVSVYSKRFHRTDGNYFRFQQNGMYILHKKVIKKSIKNHNITRIKQVNNFPITNKIICPILHQHATDCVNCMSVPCLYNHIISKSIRNKLYSCVINVCLCQKFYNKINTQKLLLFIVFGVIQSPSSVDKCEQKVEQLYSVK